MHIEPIIKRRRGRPPKIESEVSFSKTKNALLRSGMEVMTEKGYIASGIDEILRKVGVPKGSFYYYFKSKEGFGLALINNYSSFFKHKLDKFLRDEKKAPLERIKAFLNDATLGMAKYQFKRGCLVGNLGQEMSALPESFRDELKNVFLEWELKLADCLEEAKRTGAVSADLNCQEAAYYFWVSWEGAVLRAKLEGNSNALTLFSKQYLRHLM